LSHRAALAGALPTDRLLDRVSHCTIPRRTIADQRAALKVENKGRLQTQGADLSQSRPLGRQSGSPAEGQAPIGRRRPI
jgi:hypothetical protein